MGVGLRKIFFKMGCFCWDCIVLIGGKGKEIFLWKIRVYVSVLRWEKYGFFKLLKESYCVYGRKSKRDSVVRSICGYRYVLDDVRNFLYLVNIEFRVWILMKKEILFNFYIVNMILYFFW